MRANIVPLHREAKAPLQNKVVAQTSLRTLSPLAAKVLLLIAYQAAQRDRELKARGIPASRRTVSDLTFTLPWRQLRAHVAPAGDASGDREYRYLRRAMKELVAYHAELDKKNVDGKRSFNFINLLQDANYDEGGADLVYVLSYKFARALEILGDTDGFTLIPLHDAFALDETRHITLLMLAARARNFVFNAKREVPVSELREKLGLDGAAYVEWRQVWAKLRRYAAVINSKTRFRITLVPDRKRLRHVEVVRFDVTYNERKPKPTLTHAARRRLSERRVGPARPGFKFRKPAPPVIHDDEQRDESDQMADPWDELASTVEAGRDRRARLAAAKAPPEKPPIFDPDDFEWLATRPTTRSQHHVRPT